MAEQGNVKLGAAVVGGYLLGRFKKGRQAMRLAAYLNGGQTPPQMLITSGKQGAQGLLKNEQVKEIVDQLRGPVLEALQKTALAQVNSRVSGLSNKLESKTQELQAGGKQVVDTTADTAGQATDTAKRGLFGRRKSKDENIVDEEAQAEPEEPETEEEPEGEEDLEDENVGDEEPEDEEDDEDEDEPEPEDGEDDEVDDETEEPEAEEPEAEEPEPEPEPEPKPRAKTRRPRTRG